MANILVFGASTTYGAWDPEGGWVQRLRKFLDQKIIASNLELYFIVYNLGISGDDTEGILERFEDETKRRISADEETTILFSAAINDSLFDNKDKSLRCPPPRYQKNIEKLILLARKYTDKIIFVGTLPVDETRVDPIPWLPTHSYKNKYVEKYNEITKAVCRLNNVGVVEIYSKFINKNYQDLLEDGVHGNTKGYELIYEEVKNYLLDNHIIEL